MTVYLDTSAAAKLLVREPESEALRGYLDDTGPFEPPYSSGLLETELRRMATRAELSQAAVSAVLARFELVEADRSLFYTAGILPGQHLRSLDALHLATAMRLGATVVVAYDVRLLEAARSLGMGVASPRDPAPTSTPTPTPT